MHFIITRWLRSNWTILSNAGSLIATLVATSGLGFIYWWTATRLFEPNAVGLASAAVASMTLLGHISLLGLGTLLMGELPRQPEQAVTLISTALFVVISISMVFTSIYILAVPVLSPHITLMVKSLPNMALFTLGVVLTAVTLLLDQAVVGLLRSDLQLWRNILFAVSKLIILAIVGFRLTAHDGMTIYSTWTAGNLLSLLVLLTPVLSLRIEINRFFPRWQLIRDLRRGALAHHVLNLVIQSTGLLLPIMVITLASAELNASFYIAWIIVTVLFAVSNAFTTVLYVISAENPAVLARKMRLTLGIPVGVGVLVSLFISIGAYPLLMIFGPSYATDAEWCLRLLTFGIFPVIIKHHFIAICRIRGRVGAITPWLVLGSLTELCLASVGTYFWSLTGLAAGWLLAVSIEALLMGRTVIGALTTTEDLPAFSSSRSIDQLVASNHTHN